MLHPKVFDTLQSLRYALVRRSSTVDCPSTVATRLRMVATTRSRTPRISRPLLQSDLRCLRRAHISKQHRYRELPPHAPPGTFQLRARILHSRHAPNGHERSPPGAFPFRRPSAVSFAPEAPHLTGICVAGPGIHAATNWTVAIPAAASSGTRKSTRYVPVVPGQPT